MDTTKAWISVCRVTAGVDADTGGAQARYPLVEPGHRAMRVFHGFMQAALLSFLVLLTVPALAQIETKKPAPKMAGAFPALPGTTWRIDFGRGVTGTAFLFCKSGRWEIVPSRAGSIGAVGKTHKVSGDILTTVNADDGQVEKFKMAWKENVLELNDGKTVLRLYYSGETQC